MATLNGIDVSSNQPSDICKLVSYDFAIVKASGNPGGSDFAWNYVNPYMNDQVTAVLSKTGLAGLYHFTYGLDDPYTEAKFFLDTVKQYIGRVMLVIDWEGYAVTAKGINWLHQFVAYIQKETGINPVIYAGASDIKAYGLVRYAKEWNCGLWSANYWLGYEPVNGYDISGKQNDTPSAIMWQYTSSGRLEGYSGNLDLNIFYGSKAQFKSYFNATTKPQPTPTEELPDDVETLAANIIAGKYGRGAKRKKTLGAYYNGAQAMVDYKLGYIPDYEAVAKDVWAGVWGNGETRKRRLGAIYEPVQNIVDNS